MFKRKIYNKIKEWKDTSQGKTALLIEGARRIGKSTVVEEFARNEYKSYILIDFSIASNEVKEMFEDMSDLNYFFLQLQLHYHVELENRNSVIIFDEVQLCPKARQAIKFLVKDGRYDYIETDPATEPSAKAGSVSHSSIVQALGLFFPNKQDCKPGSVLDGHLSSPAVTDGLKRPTRKQTGRLMLSVRSCFEWGLHMPLLLPGGR